MCPFTGGTHCPVASSSRCDLGDALPRVGARAWSAREHDDDGAGDQANGVDAKKKTMGASERNEEARAAWREHQRLLDATRWW